MDFNFVGLAKSFIKKENQEEKEKTNTFVRKLERKFRELFIKKRDSSLLDNPTVTLFSLYDNLEIMKTIPHNNYDVTNLIKSKMSPPVLYITDNFKENFAFFTEHQLTDLDW